MRGDLPATCTLVWLLGERLGRQRVPSGYHLPTSDQQYPASLLFPQVRSPVPPFNHGQGRYEGVRGDWHCVGSGTAVPRYLTLGYVLAHQRWTSSPGPCKSRRTWLLQQSDCDQVIRNFGLGE